MGFLTKRMEPMSDRGISQQSTRDRTEETTADDDEAIETVEAYEVDDGIVLYDAEQPLAWIETDTAVSITEMA